MYRYLMVATLAAATLFVVGAKQSNAHWYVSENSVIVSNEDPFTPPPAPVADDCGCEAVVIEPSCGAEPTCGVEPTCGCDYRLLQRRPIRTWVVCHQCCDCCHMYGECDCHWRPCLLHKLVVGVKKAGAAVAKVVTCPRRCHCCDPITVTCTGCAN